MTVSTLIATYVIVLLAGMAAAMIYTEFRQRHFKPTPSNDRIFRCPKCGYVYTDDPDVDRSRCSQCGQLNEPIQF
jgi:rubrerythrin